LGDPDFCNYLDNISDNRKLNIAVVSDDYLIEVIGNGVDYPDSLKASIKKGDSAVATTTKNTDINASTSP
jgi:hypothetical protein